MNIIHSQRPGCQCWPARTQCRYSLLVPKPLSGSSLCPPAGWSRCPGGQDSGLHSALGAPLALLHPRRFSWSRTSCWAPELPWASLESASRRPQPGARLLPLRLGCWSSCVAAEVCRAALTGVESEILGRNSFPDTFNENVAFKLEFDVFYFPKLSMNTGYYVLLWKNSVLSERGLLTLP